MIGIEGRVNQARDIRTRRSMRWYALLLVAVLSCCHRDAPPDAPPDAATDAVAKLESKLAMSNAALAKTCEDAGFRLPAAQKNRCADAHMKLGRNLLEQRKYEDARSALAFAEMEGASLKEVRSLRGQIPGYEKLTATVVPLPGVRNEISPEIARTIRISSAIGLSSILAGGLRGWQGRAAAGGNDCDVLIITLWVKMDPPMIEGLHEGQKYYGTFLPGGVRQFAEENGFRGVLYRDGMGSTWQYGRVRADDWTVKRRCRP